MTRHQRSDLSPLQPVTRLPDGRVMVDALLTRAGIFVYSNPDGSVRRELRPFEEVFEPGSMASFRLVPFTDDHPPEMVSSDNAREYAKGSTGDTITRDQDHLRGKIGVFDGATIDKMDSGKHELSCGYTCDIEERAGVHPLWGPYDAVQRNIRGNHVALVEHGRAGSARLRMDGLLEGRPAKTTKGKRKRDAGPVRPSSGGLIPATQLTRKIVSPQRGSDGLFVNLGQTGPDRELEEGHRRLGWANAFNYADPYTGNTRTYDDTGRYNCGRCNKHDDGNSCLLVTVDAVDDEGGSCEDWENQCAGDPELKSRAKSPEAAGYDIVKNGTSWGCDHCKWASPAIPDSRGRSLYCGKGDFRVFPHACCAINGAPVVEIDKKTGLPIGTGLAQVSNRGTLDASMARQARTDLTSAGSPDPNDLASRNSRDPNRDDDDDDEDEDMMDDDEEVGVQGKPAKPSAPAPDSPPADPDAPDPDMSAAPDEENDDSIGMYDEDGQITPMGERSVAAASFAIPGKQRLPIHTPAAVKSSMKAFGSHEFDDADEKHAAFNRIKAKATAFNIGTNTFNKLHAGKLDRKDHQMADAETNRLARKAIKRAKQRDAEKARADKAEADLAAAQGRLASLEEDLKRKSPDASAESEPRGDSADFATMVAKKTDLVVKATAILGAGRVDAKMSDRDIKTAVIKHVDKIDVAADKHWAYVDALFDGAVARARTDAAAIAAGAAAVDAARAAATPGAGAPIQPEAPRADAAESDEDAARRRMAERSRNAYKTPGRMTRDSIGK